jgi:exosortase
MTFDKKRLSAVALIGLGLALVYWQVFVRLVDAWIVDGNYSHGFLILPIAGYLAWERKDRLLAEPLRPSWIGLLVVLGGILILIAGLLGSELFLSRISLLATCSGIILFLFGWGHLRILAFPLAFLLLMIPLPAIIFNKIALPLQLLASRAGEWAIAAANIPVLREGNVLILANTSLEVAEACSGIRSLVSLLTLAIVYGYFMDSRGWFRGVIALSTLPIAIVANGARVAGTGIASHWWGPSVAQGFFHEFSGWVVFIVAFAMVLGVQRLLLLIAPAVPRGSRKLRATAVVGAEAAAPRPSPVNSPVKR